MGTDEENEAELRLGSRAGAAFSNPSASQLARDSENTSLNRSAIVSASVSSSKLCADYGAMGSGGGNQPADSTGIWGDEPQAGLQADSQKNPHIRKAKAPRASGQSSSSVYIRVIRG